MSDVTPQLAGNANPRRDTIVAAVLIFLGVFALFARAITFDQVHFDDNMFVFNNPHVAGGLTWSNVVWAMTDTSTTGWYPMHHLSYMLDTTLWGREPWGYHLTSVLLHALNAALLFVTLRWMTRSMWASVAATLLFAVHPLRVEAVVWIAERKGVLAGTFWMLTMLAYLRYAARPGAARYALVAALMALGLMAKAVLVTMPFALLLLDYWPLRRWRVHADADDATTEAAGPPPFATASAGRLIAEKLPLLALCIADAGMMIYASVSGGTMATKIPKPLTTRLAYAVDACALYLRETFWPHDLMMPHMLTADFAVGVVVASAVALLVITAALAVAWRRRPVQRGYLPVGWLWYLGVLTPTLGVVLQIADFARADRYTYVPSVGVCLLVVWGGRELIRRRPRWRPVAAAACVAVVLALSVTTVVQMQHWRSVETLFLHTLTIDPDNRFAHHNLADYYGQRGELAKAEHHYRYVLDAIRPPDPRASYARFNLGMIVERQGRTDEAIEWYEKANALEGGHGLDVAQTNIGVLAFDRGDLDEAERRFREAIAADATHANAWYNLGRVALRRGDDAQAIEHLRHAVELAPTMVNAWRDLGVVLGKTGRAVDALDAIKHAADLAPADPEILLAYGNALMTARRPADAAEAYAALLKVVPDNADTRMRLGMALGNSGAIDKALPHLEAAARLAPDKAVHWFNLGMIYRALRRNDDAVTAFNKALAIDPKFNDARRQLDALRAAPPTPNDAGKPSGATR
ncbi:MAG: tetratricopeptide repeat protein [Phycisphaera sp.]|nr:tetratricopeptide repeat protein [Phycisphaera sp.]